MEKAYNSLPRGPALIDLFAGVGGLSLGACRAGFDLRLAVEIDKHASAAHAKNFPNSVHSAADIASVSGAELLKLARVEPGELSGLIGGPPCQGFSNMGHRNVDDPRNDLFRRFFQLVCETGPAFFLAENVPGILDPRYAPMRDAALNLVRSNYTLLEPFKVVAADYGVPTIRTRVIFFGYRSSAFSSALSVSDFRAGPNTAKVTVGTALGGLPITIKDTWLTDDEGWRVVRSWPGGSFGERAKGRRPEGVGDEESVKRLRDERRVSGCVATIHTSDVIGRYMKLGPGEVDTVSRAVRLDKNGYCPTLRAGTDSDRGSYQALRPIHPEEPRVITTREAARLQGFPDWFRFAPTKWHSFRQIGNSVSPVLAEALLSRVRSKLNSSGCQTARDEDAA